MTLTVINSKERRAKHEPISYITGSKEFWSLPFEVDKHTLIPRPSTESLVEASLSLFGKDSELSILDLGTGSGCLLLSLLHEYPNARGTGVDINEGAIEVAIRNSKKLGLQQRANFFPSDWLENIPKSSFHLVVANPPYIRKDDLDSLHPSVKDWEPATALLGGKDGLECYRLIAIGLAKNVQLPIMKVGGYLLLEIGKGQEDEVEQIMSSKTSLRLVKTHNDLDGIKRCLIFK